MECFIVQESDIDLASKTLVLRGDEARHAVRVLRISEGEELMATTLLGFCYRAKCMRSGQPTKNEWECECTIEEVLPGHNEPKIDIQLIQGITLQQSKLEEIAEKVTEIGVKSIVPIYSKRTEKRTVNIERLERIVQTACKQTSRAQMPKLHKVTNFGDALQRAKGDGRNIILLHESTPFDNSLSKILAGQKNNKISLVIGPEGGFDESEVLLASGEYGASIASLGVRRLRAETAAISAIAITLAFFS
jgi:16S rRNA (uracil1498-N3)-methyltransferase